MESFDHTMTVLEALTDTVAGISDLLTRMGLAERLPEFKSERRRQWQWHKYTKV